ncbi:MAG: RagB/SusD family nutrient uptake outer membrane protein [Balneolaceae bacterium]|nr:RagB/SusD family nutrient uptake outer membrane protein [Balneolaceae bacterium]MCH8548627.1 RagB/SusD family nutrient uptake outer membrane protein [Balneolaceae bacterium]
MKTQLNKLIGFALIAVLGLYATSCVNDLNTSPIDENIETSELVFENPENFRKVLAKMYAGLSMTGQEGPAGQADIQGIDEGFSSYVRQFWTHQVISTDEAVVAWNDPGLPVYNFQQWNASNEFVRAMYSRIYYQITLANEFIREASQRDEEVIQDYMNEARFLRALSYWHVLDLFGGNVPFVTEENLIGAGMPEPTNANDLFNYIESELLEIVDELPSPGANDYGRADQGVAWTLLAKLYLNAEVHTGDDRYADAYQYAQQIIDSGAYSLADEYEHNFLIDNDETGEIIFPVRFDGDNARTFGGTTFLICASLGGTMSSEAFGTGCAWAGNRTTPEFVSLFEEDPNSDEEYAWLDGRALFHTDEQTLEIETLSDFQNGFAVEKFRNVSSTGERGKNSDFMDLDFPMFRLGDVYLMYAEAAIRAGGDLGEAVNRVNALRERAYGDDSGNISQSDLSLDFIIDERGRELYWEGHRRTDLIRFGLYTGGDYVWSYKGGSQEGSATSDHLQLFPIPSADLNENLNLEQNPGY